MSNYNPNSAGSNEEYEFFKYMQRKEQQQNQNRKKPPERVRDYILPAIFLLVVWLLFFHH